VKSFEQLTHLGRGRRLRPLAHGLLEERFGIRATSLEQIAETVNLVYRVRTSSSQRYVLRMTPPAHFHDRRDVCSEMAWLNALHQEGIGVPVPVPAQDGSTVVSTSWEGIPGEWHCVLFDWITAADLASRWTNPNIERYGRLSAQLHLAGSRFRPPQGFRIRSASRVFPHCDPAFENPEPLVLFDGAPEELISGERRALLQHAHERAHDAIERLFASGTPQPIHNDLHPWNVMINRDTTYAIDFENLLMGYPVQDIGTTLNYFSGYFRDEAPLEERVAAFRRGYESVAPWPEAYPGQIRTMTVSHRLLLCNFYASHKDPEYKEFAVEFLDWCEKRLREDLAFIEQEAGGPRK